MTRGAMTISCSGVNKTENDLLGGSCSAESNKHDVRPSSSISEIEEMVDVLWR